MTINIDEVERYLIKLQTTICHTLADIDGKVRFEEDKWDKEKLGFGMTNVLEKGHVFEKAGVNFSSISGDSLPVAASAKRKDLSNKPFKAMGVSLVIHPDNPFIPTTHANVRFFCTLEENPTWWFGGGFDLTPYFGFKEDCIHWHQVAKAACQPYGNDLYPRLKKWCDDYFYLKHRDEPRGIGGLFFDDFNEKDFNHSFNFMQSVGDAFLKAYVPIVEKRMDTPFTTSDKDFQRYRRGRYVEFNLIYDRGTLFGLQSKGRTESILMSLPPEVNWAYLGNKSAPAQEQVLIRDFINGQDWL